MNKLLIQSLFIGSLLLVYTGAFAQEHHHGHGNDSNTSETIIKIMQGMNENLGELSRAIMLENYALISSSAYDIANHPGILQEDLNVLFARLGDQKEAFIKCDTAVHDLAIELSHAGEQKDMTLILSKYSAMLSKAAECHRKYKEK